MGLDMYLTGERFLGFSAKKKKINGYPVKSELLELGYWRKHPNLHGYIVNQFADGEDNCQEIDLSAEDIRLIIKTIEDNALPHTSGFFFGASDGTEKETDLAIFNKALKWLESEDREKGVWRSVKYQASW